MLANHARLAQRFNTALFESRLCLALSRFAAVEQLSPARRIRVWRPRQSMMIHSDSRKQASADLPTSRWIQALKWIALSVLRPLVSKFDSCFFSSNSSNLDRQAANIPDVLHKSLPSAAIKTNGQEAAAPVRHQRLKVLFEDAAGITSSWKSTPQQDEVEIGPGESALVFFKIENTNGNATLYGTPMHTVLPVQVEPYLERPSAFCLQRQRLEKNESIEVPVLLSMDSRFWDRPESNQIDIIVVRYVLIMQEQ
ncbi:cytochrome c oxidase assembly protein CtaG/Cox11 [Polychaeton citri CBS 116435]|uniref:Cytochrome c oxidase assembly protein CtaG/Cox11 n=1 Tax=Polychaeton citri CBS 116435 TaxID=1314669 RepID=A0A9P4QGX8_9PEZI|nr:cytochrome c oxidase assembly protein CtaG/Cox11 [Polychaeton citri CBS 116435]